MKSQDWSLGFSYESTSPNTVHVTGNGEIAGVTSRMFLFPDERKVQSVSKMSDSSQSRHFFSHSIWDRAEKRLKAAPPWTAGAGELQPARLLSLFAQGILIPSSALIPV